MAPNDRIIIVVAVLLMVVSLSAGALLVPHIIEERTDKQLTASADMQDALPPDVAALYMGLGSFRGLMVDILWGRLETMKNEGKYWEAAQLAEWVTKLQPRFPQVWSYHAWNLAYNVSVATHTPDERWSWVSKGVTILRDQGIPMNPESVLLYKELAWIFLHKIGQFSDDMHWHYKKRLAMEWHMLLGPPREGRVPSVDRLGNPVLTKDGKPILEYAAIADQRPIAWAYEDYLNRTTLPTKIRNELERLAEDTYVGEALEPLGAHKFDRFKVKLNRLAPTLDEQAAERIAPLVKMTAEHDTQMRRDPLVRLREDAPDVAAQYDALVAMGLDLDGEFTDERLIREIGLLLGRVDSFAFELLGLDEARPLGPIQTKLVAWLVDPEIAHARRRLLGFFRARILRDRYHMDPSWMLQLAEGDWFLADGDRAERKMFTSESDEEDIDVSIPIDWRHPAAHGLYWSSLGVKVSHGLRRPEDYDVLNTDRQVLHALQAMTHNGQIIFDPVQDYYNQLPDPRFIDAYHYAVFGAWDRITKLKKDKLKDVGVAPESFQAGHENFLIWSTNTAYFWGREKQAARYYAMLREHYSDFFQDRKDRYSRPLEEFVLTEFYKEEGGTSLYEANAAIFGRIRMAIQQGLLNGRGDLAKKYLSEAARAHKIYQDKQNYETEGAEGQNRMALKPFGQMVSDMLSQFLESPSLPLLAKARAWKTAENWMKLPVYDRVGPKLQAMCKAYKPPLPMARLFPEPLGLDAYRQRQKEAQEAAEKENKPDAPTIRK